VIPVPSPNWFYYDISFGTNVLPYLGPERAEHMMPMKSFVNNGSIVVMGTDFPACVDYPTMNPLDEIRTGITRLPLPPDSNITKVYWPEERVDLKTMIECATINGAYAAFMENETGSLEKGKLADLVVIDSDLFKILPQDINKAHVLATILEGKEVFGAFTEEETISLRSQSLEKLSAFYADLFNGVARNDVLDANGLLAKLDGNRSIYWNNTLMQSARIR
jgi:predicted amidohydrolase YtcJ